MLIGVVRRQGGQLGDALLARPTRTGLGKEFVIVVIKLGIGMPGHVADRRFAQ